jgi:hypothetical protein
MANEKQVPVYYIGVHFKNAQRRPTFNVKGVPYHAPASVGEHIMVAQNDVEELIEKSRAEIRGKGSVETFTTSPDVAAAVTQQFIGGKEMAVPVRVSVQDAMGMMTPEMLKERVLNEFSADELEDLLKIMKPDIETAQDVEAAIVAEAHAEEILEEEEKPKRKRGRPKKDEALDLFAESKEE